MDELHRNHDERGKKKERERDREEESLGLLNTMCKNEKSPDVCFKLLRSRISLIVLWF